MSPDWIPFCSVVFTEVSAGIPEVFSVAIVPLLLFTMGEAPGSVLTAPWLLSCEELSCFTGEEWMATTLLVPCVFKEGLEVVFEGVAATVFFAKEFLALEEGEDNRVAIFALAELSFFLCFFSLSFSPLKKRKQKLHVTRHRLTHIYVYIL